MEISDLSGHELELLASIPYKVGVYVSHADDEDGEIDDEREMKALSSCIKAIAGLHEDQPVVADIMRQTMAMHGDWPKWASFSFRAPEEAAQAMSILKSKAGEQTQKNFRAAVMEVATMVAQAYGEFGEFENDDMGDGLFSGIVSKIAGKLSALGQDDAGHPMNISAAEDTALAEISAALQI